MSTCMCHQMLSVDIHHCRVVNTAKPEYYPLVMPVVVHIEGAIIPGPTHEISQARVHRDVVVAGWDRHVDGSLKRSGEPVFREPPLPIQTLRCLEVPHPIK